MNKRNEQIDVMRGIGILLMVYGHCCRANSVIALFHMSLFFVISGYCFNDDNCGSIRKVYAYFKRKVKSLWVPYFFFTSLFLIGTNIFIKVGIYTNDPSILTIKNSMIDKIHHYLGIKECVKMFVMEFFFQTETQLGGALWFLQCLFFSSVLFALTTGLLQKIFQSIHVREFMLVIISVASLLLGYYCSINSIWIKGFNRVFSCFWILTFGQLIKRHDIMRQYKNELAFAALGMLIILDRYGKISLVANEYPNPVFLVGCSILGWFMVYGASNMILAKCAFCGNILQYIGRHSISIIGLHFLSFKIITFLIMHIRNYPHIYLATFPVIYDYVWVIPYMILGIGLPLLAGRISIRCKLKIREVLK
ncbi:acyltransferase family protein [Anaerobutyricum hallii]|jgi:fucose 4-O-acetylase-like acetyltransferase|uniref:acyltransferase family protein n=1 Tax=Anaerobutyricum hallii TaxID=39488 RepID=UPI002ED2F035